MSGLSLKSQSPAKQQLDREVEGTVVACSDVAAHKRFAGIGEAVHDIAEEGEELHEEGIDGKHFGTDIAAGSSDEGEDCRETDGAEEDVAVDLEEELELRPVQGRFEQWHYPQLDGGVRFDAAHLADEEEEAYGKAAVLCYHCTQRHAFNVPVEHQHEE